MAGPVDEEGPSDETGRAPLPGVGGAEAPRDGGAGDDEAWLTVLAVGMSNFEFYTTSAIGLLLSLPTYYGLFAFSKPTDPAWKKA